MRRATVTQLVDFAKCEKLGILKLSRKEALNAQRQKAVDHGIEAHARFEKTAVVDGRCFVSSFAYGETHRVTDELRVFRDQRMMPSQSGRWLVERYYLVSPWAVGALAKIPHGKAVGRAIVWLGRIVLGLVFRRGGGHGD